MRAASLPLVRALALVLVLALAAVGATDTQHIAQFSADRVELVDRVGNNFLFRGGQAINEHGFAYGPLKAALGKAAGEAGVQLAEKFHLVDVSLLSLREYGALEVEKLFFASHPDAGQFLNWGITGDLMRPLAHPEGVREQLVRTLPNWMADRLPERTSKLRHILSQASEEPVVVYVHGGRGGDRTAELIAAYEMEFKGRAMLEVLKARQAKMGRPMLYFTAVAVEWYCEFLRQVKGVATVGSCDSGLGLPPTGPAAPEQ